MKCSHEKSEILKQYEQDEACTLAGVCVCMCVCDSWSSRAWVSEARGLSEIEEQ